MPSVGPPPAGNPRSAVSVPASTSRDTLADMLCIVVVGAAVCLPFLGQEDYLAPREVRHAEIAAEMAASGDFLIPRSVGELYEFKPPVLHIPVALLYRLCGGPSLFLARLPSALAAILGALALYGLARLLHDRRTALWAAVALCGVPGYAVLAHTARADMIFTAALLAGTLALVAGWRTQSLTRRAGWFALGGLAMGLANLSKGPYGIAYVVVFAAAATCGYFAVDERWREEWQVCRSAPGRWVGARLMAGLAFAAGFCAAVASWVVPVALRDGGAYLRDVLSQYNPALEGVHARPFYFYIGIGLRDLLPWTLALPLVFLTRAWRSTAAVICVLVLVALSCSVGKREHYLGPWFPFALLVLVAAWRAWAGRTWMRRLGWTALAVSWLCIPLYYGWFVTVRFPEGDLDRDFALTALRDVPDGSTLLCYGGYGEEFSWRLAVAKRKDRVEFMKVDTPAQVAAAAREAWRVHRPFHLVVSRAAWPACRDALPGWARTILLERFLKKMRAETDQDTWVLVRLESPATPARGP